MFDKQYRFTGSHAEMVSDLTAIFDADAKAKLFDRNLDVYINAPLVGFLFKRKGQKNTNSEIADQNIFPEQLINNSDTLKYILRVLLILDSEYEPDAENRLDRAFRKLGADPKDLELFDSYVLGGVEVLHEKLIESVSNPAEYVSALYDFLEEYNDRFNEGISNEDILKLCRAESSD